MIPRNTKLAMANLVDDDYADEAAAQEALRHIERATAFLVYLPRTDTYRVGWFPALEEV